jgi:hypothetical protein
MSSKSNPASAPGPYLGFALQPVRLCYYLLNGENDDVVSIETRDDIEITTGKKLVLEQTKSALSHNPVSDFAMDLWKTFSNWITQIKNDQVVPSDTRFRLYVTPIYTGEIVSMLHAAKTDAAADKCVKHIQDKLDALPRRPSCYRYLRHLLELDPKTRRQLIRNFEYDSAHEDPVDAIREIIRAPLSQNIVDTCCEYAIGKAKEEADALIREDKIPSITSGPFQRAFKAFVKKNDLSGLLKSIATQPSESEVTATLAGSPPFVRQLDFIELPQDLRLRAVSDFLQASADKTHWAANGDIVEDSLQEFDNKLVKAHGFTKLTLEDQIPATAGALLGRRLYAECCKGSHKIEDREPPSHFIPGCFNDLANRVELGWHPNYVALLEKPEN